MPSIGSPDLWAKFGLPGLVIFALFAILIAVVWFTIRRFDKVDERNKDHIKDMALAHREERAEWRESSAKQIDKFETSITRLADGIRDTRGKD